MRTTDSGSHRTFFRVDKWDAEQAAWTAARLAVAEPQAHHFRLLRVRPYETGESEGNLITDAGWNLLMKNAAGSAGTLFSATVGRIGVGNGSTAVAYADTDLSAASGSGNRQFKLISATPTVGSTHSAGLVFTASLGSGQANFAWQEFGTDQGTADGTTVTSVFFNHGLSSQGTKTSGQVWSVTETIAWS